MTAPSDYHRPTALPEALRLLGEAPHVVAAGCTDLYPATQSKSLAGPVLDVTAIADLRGITEDAAGWRIGAATTWTDIVEAHLPPPFLGLQQAAKEVGAIQIQNSGTIAGNLCTASPAGDGIPPLLTLDASVELASERGTRLLPLSQFLTGARRTALAEDELITAILVPAPAAQGHAAFQKLGARHSLVISIAMVAVRLAVEDGRIAEAAIAVGACSPVAQRLPGIETDLIGAPLHAAAARVRQKDLAAVLSPIDDIRADATYRVTAATELVCRALSGLAAVLEQEAA